VVEAIECDDDDSSIIAGDDNSIKFSSSGSFKDDDGPPLLLNDKKSYSTSISSSLQGNRSIISFQGANSDRCSTRAIHTPSIAPRTVNTVHPNSYTQPVNQNVNSTHTALSFGEKSDRCEKSVETFSIWSGYSKKSSSSN
jgi:hypothetical protein